ncbi:MAG: LytTR family transcriptional regulator [Bacteroidales bacterium]|jgi:hypothetical protein|nr:LytTR family transcriptional regulator [Bacteroidales bacterium]OJX88888.1 MAG: LytTR family transcriptional regulator [Paludibacter sp. 47-17]
MATEKNIPAYLVEKDNTTHMILFTAFFALLFINLFQPFGSRNWYPNITDFKYFFFSSLIILTGMLVVVLSRVIMHRYSRRNNITYIRYGAWIVAEIFAMSLFYALFSKYVPEGSENRDFMEILQQAIFNTSLVLLLPYGISMLYFSWKEKSKLLEEHKELAGPPEIPRKRRIAFTDEKGEVKITIELNHLVYIESADNYATIHYINKERLSRFPIRNSLKYFEQNLIEDTPLVRCHRSYIINLDKVKVLKKTKDGIFMELDLNQLADIPVSKTYYDSVMQKFSQYSV